MLNIPIRVQFYETDMMEIAHHTNHLRWFEMARIEFFRNAGIELWDMMNKDIVFPILSISCHYKEAAKFDDQLIIETRLVKMTKAQMVFTYRIIRKKDGRVLAVGETQNAFSSKSSGKIIRLPDIFYKPLVKLVECETGI